MTSRDRRSLPVLLLALAGLLATAAAPAGTGSDAPGSPAVDPGGFLELVLHHEAERSGDYDALAQAWLGALSKFLDDPRAPLVPHRLRALAPWLRRPRAIVEPIESILEDARLEGPLRSLLASLLAREYERLGRHAEADTLLREETGLVESYLLAGPFGKDKRAPLEHAFPPEGEIDLEARYTDGWQELSWRRASRKPGELRTVPYDEVYPQRGVVYFLAQVRSSGTRQGILHISSGGEVKVWVNGALAVDDTRRRTILPRFRAAGIQLEDGWNRILVKSASPFSVHLTDPERNVFPRGALEEESGLALHEPARGAPGRWDGPYRASASDLWRVRLEKSSSREAEVATEPDAGEALSRALDRIGLAVLYAAEGRDDLAVVQAERATALAENDAWVRFAAGSIFESARYLPSSQSKNRSQSEWESAVALDPDFLPAEERLARALELDQRTTEAIEKMRQAVTSAPTYLPGYLRLQSLYEREHWTADEREVLRRIAEVAPEVALPHIEEARRYERRGHPERALEEYRKAYEEDRSLTPVLSSIGRIESRRGDLEKAEEALRERLRIEPEAAGAVEDLARVLLRQDRRDDAQALARARVEARPWDPHAHRLHARILEESGTVDEAIAAYDRALAIAPGDVSLREYIQSERGARSEFWEPYDEDLEDWLSRLPEDGPLVERSAALGILDIAVVELHEDGSSSEFVHQAYRLLSEKARDELARVEVPGEAIRLRTLTAGGASLEPVAALENGQYVLPGMAPGAIAEVAYRANRSEAQGSPFRYGPFFFQDHGFQRSFLLSRFVLIVPPEARSELIETAIPRRREGSDLAEVEKTERRLEDGRRIIIYEARGVPRLDRERSMPRPGEYLPNVEVRPERSWQDLEAELRAGVRELALATPELEEAARRATEGVKTPIEKAKALYRFVNELVPTGNGPGQAVQVLLEKSGDRTALYKALLDAAGVPASWAFVRPRELIAPEGRWSSPEADMFPWRCILIEAAETEPVWTLLAYRHLPFGQLPEHLGGGRALVLSERGMRLIAVPVPAVRTYESWVDGTASLGDGAAADVEFTTGTLAATGYLQKERFANLDASMTKVLTRTLAARMFPGAQVRDGDFVAIDTHGSPFAMHLALTAPAFLTRSGEDYLLAPVLRPPSLVATYGGPVEREHPYELRQPVYLRERLRVKLGTAWRIRRLPRDTVLAGKLVSYSLAYSLDGDELAIERQVHFEPGRLEPDEFAGFVEILEAADTAEKERIVLRRK